MCHEDQTQAMKADEWLCVHSTRQKTLKMRFRPLFDSCVTAKFPYICVWYRYMMKLIVHVKRCFLSDRLNTVHYHFTFTDSIGSNFVFFLNACLLLNNMLIYLIMLFCHHIFGGFEIFMSMHYSCKINFFKKRQEWVCCRVNEVWELCPFLYVGIRVGTMILLWDSVGVVYCLNCSRRNTGNCITWNGSKSMNLA